MLKTIMMKTMENNELETKLEKVTRFEIINHADNNKPIGRLLTMYQELNDFNTIELSFQDGGKTLKIFIS
jgi:hypothetical protein